jgi:hypothetical protein
MTHLSGPETSIKASRARLLLVTVAPVLLSLVVASVELSRTSLPELECWVIPSGRIIAVQGWDQCPVESNARLRRIQADDGRRANVDSLEQLQRWFASNTKTAEVRLWTSKDGDEQVYDAVSVTSLAGRDVAARLGSAVLAAIVLMYLPFQLLRQSNSQAAIPLAVHYASISVLVIVVLSGRNSFWLQRIGLLSSIVIPATLAHLTLTFPRVRPIILERPSTVFVPYVLAALLFARRLVGA